MLPAGLDVGHLQRVADGLHRAHRGAVGGAEQRHHAQGQLVAGWAGGRESTQDGCLECGGGGHFFFRLEMVLLMFHKVLVTHFGVMVLRFYFRVE